MQELRIAHISELATDMIFQMKTDPTEYLGVTVDDWPNFTKCFGGARGELVTITADTGMGKSTFLRNWIFQLVSKGVPCMLISLEDHMRAVIRVMQQMITGLQFSALSEDEIGEVIRWMSKTPLFYLEHQGVVKHNFALKLIDYCGQVLKTKFVVIDHLDYCAPEWDRRPETYVIGDFLRQLSGRAGRYNMTVALVAHPAKRGLKGDETMEVGLDELKGSSSIKQESASVLALHRPEKDTGVTNLRFLKIRCPEYGKFTGARIAFKMLPNSGCFVEQGEIEWN